MSEINEIAAAVQAMMEQESESSGFTRPQYEKSRAIGRTQSIRELDVAVEAGIVSPKMVRVMSKWNQMVSVRGYEVVKADEPTA